MLAKDIMSRRVISVEPDAAVVHAVRLMLQHRISGLPVIQPDGQMVGILSEGDLLRRVEHGTQRKRPRWLEFIVGPGQLAGEYVRAAGGKVRDVMTERVQTVDEDASLEEVVERLERYGIKRLPVVKDGKVVGIITRANLLHALAAIAAEAKPAPSSDEAIRTALLAELDKQPWAPTSLINIVVRNGVVGLWGTILDERQREALLVAAENTPGVKGVEDHLSWVEPNSGLVIEPPERRS
ncbi:MAG TPA: CBS domain-containing protein [Xanthobacteraceae bacterium]|nr:CBS domain-containing protein [Xanthobacteraceae bacterium]